MPRDQRAYLADIVESCDAIVSAVRAIMLAKKAWKPIPAHSPIPSTPYTPTHPKNLDTPAILEPENGRPRPLRPRKPADFGQRLPDCLKPPAESKKMPNEPNPTSGTLGCIALKNQEITTNAVASKQRTRLGSFAAFDLPCAKSSPQGNGETAGRRASNRADAPRSCPKPSRPRPGASPSAYTSRPSTPDSLCQAGSAAGKVLPERSTRRPRPSTKPGPSVHIAASREGPGQIQNQNAPNEANLSFVFNTRRKKRTQSARRAPLLLDNPFAALLIFWHVLIS